ncbi:uncharacterized protein LODBEIA_P28230 [Lodderomyces beijingensis]|uniref:LicD/FKTN/FKRP nucleotidyltransferase domain-containing protein n=1 Tax=Lodderomyces beijingensis TaxID=1775926 RepID=A0ABP0ZL33_9ASCO
MTFESSLPLAASSHSQGHTMSKSKSKSSAAGATATVTSRSCHKFHVFTRRLFNAKFVKVLLAVVVVINIFYITSFILEDRKLAANGGSISGLQLQNNKQQSFQRPSTRLVPAPNHIQNLHNGGGAGGGSSLKQVPRVFEVPNDEISFFNTVKSKGSKSYSVPDGVPYHELSADEKIAFKLREVSEDKEKYWLGHTELTDYEIRANVKDFLYENWIGKPVLFYDPRFTLSIYLSEIRNQFLEKNPENFKLGQGDVNEIILPFAWSDWVNITMLNQELVKPEKERKNCDYMKATHHMAAQDPAYCINNADIVNSDLKDMKLPSVNYVPGFAVKKSPTNKASNEVRMLEGKSHLLTYAANPLSMILMSEDGVYEVKIDGKQRIVDGDLFDNYLKDNNIARDEKGTIVLNPVKEFNLLVEQIPPRPLDPEEDKYGMVAKIKETDALASREIHLPESAFNYQQDKIDAQIEHYEERLKQLKDLTTNELNFDLESIDELRLSRSERLYYEGLKYANSFPLKKEPTYFRMARLNFGNAENDHDAGWHYEWRFFNGALRYLKKGWTKEELLIREKVLLDRILRNWFKFANLKGIISWIAHGPLLSWYWDGLLFPFDEDIDVQMPAEQLINFCKSYNQTLVIEDINEGFGKYFIECSAFVHHRGRSYKNNHIDARFIDIDTGSYIDITGLGASNEEVPERYNELIQQNDREGKTRQVYNCRFPHFYSYNEISPLRYTMLGGVPVFVPSQIETILKQEYAVGMTSYHYEGFFFIDALNLWIHYSKLAFLFAPEYDDTGDLDVEKFTVLVQNITKEQIVQLLENDEDILLEYYLTKDATDTHKQELAFMFQLNNGTDTCLKEVNGAMKTSDEISNNRNYHELTSQFKFQKPFRRALFNYEAIDQPKHHQDKPST